MASNGTDRHASRPQIQCSDEEVLASFGEKIARRSLAMTNETGGANWRRVLAPPLILLAVVSGLVLAWYSAHSLLMLFAGILFAVFLDACTRGLGSSFPCRAPGGSAWSCSVSLARGAGDRLGRPRDAGPGAHADSGDGRAAHRPRELSGDLRHRPVRTGRPARPVAVHRRSRAAVRPRPLRRERRLRGRHQDDRHRLPRPVLRRQPGRLSRGRPEARVARRPRARRARS